MSGSKRPTLQGIDTPATSNLAGVPIASNITHGKRKRSKPHAVDFVPKEFDQLLEDQGTFVRITPSILCPNRTGLDDTNHALDCPLCFGQETIDLDDEAKESWASVTSIHLDKKFELGGIYDLKDAKMTFQTQVRVNYWYKIEIIDFGSIFNQIIKRGTGNADRLRYHVFGACDIPIYLKDSLGKTYRVNEDFVTDGPFIRWRGNKPESDKLYSISYPIVPVFRVLDLVNENRYYYVGFKQKDKIPVQLPQQALVRWDYLARRSGSSVLNE
jgi:hypothetical protein